MSDVNRSIAVTPGSSVTARRIEWWEPDLIVASAINLIAAREGIGKSTVAASWAARETRNGGTVLGSAPKSHAKTGRPADVRPAQS